MRSAIGLCAGDVETTERKEHAIFTIDSSGTPVTVVHDGISYGNSQAGTRMINAVVGKNDDVWPVFFAIFRKR